ncbi:unnamed protein product [Caenorhabditis brenneri]
MPRIEAVSIVVRESCGYMSKKIALVVRGHIKDHRKMSQRRFIDQYQYGFGRKTEESTGHKENTSCQGFHQDASTTSGVSEVARHLYANRSIRRCYTSSCHQAIDTYIPEKIIVKKIIKRISQNIVQHRSSSSSTIQEIEEVIRHLSSKAQRRQDVNMFRGLDCHRSDKDLGSIRGINQGRTQFNEDTKEVIKVIWRIQRGKSKSTQEEETPIV